MEPLPKVPKAPPKRAYDYTPEENEEIVKDQGHTWLENLKKPKQPDFPSTKEEVDKAWKIVKTLNNPPVLIGNYERQIIKANERRKERVKKSSSASGKSVAQLGQQKNQSCPPLKVFFDTEVVLSRAAARILIRSLLQCTEKRPRLTA